jgi:hypothetical protein
MIGQGLGRVAQAEKLSIQQLEEALENRTIPAYIGIPLLEEKVQIEQRMKMAQAGQMPPPEMTIADQVMGQAQELSGGIDQAPIDFAPEMAGGGIVAFEDGGQVQRFQNQGMVQEQIPPMTPEELRRYQLTKQLPERFKNAAQTDPGALEDPGIAPRMDQPAPPPDQGLGAATRGFEPLDPTKILEQTETLYGGLYGKGTGAAAPGDKMGYVQKAEDFFKAAGVNLDMAAQQAAEIAAEKESLGKDREEAKNMRIMEAGFAIMAGTSPNAFENIGKGATKAMQGFASDIKDLQKTERELGNASRQMMQAQNQIRMGVATSASDDYQKAVDRYNAANKDIADRKASLADKIMSDNRARQIVEAQSKSSTYEQMRSDALSGDPKRQAFAEKYLGMSKTGAAGETTYSTEWTRASLAEKMKYRQQGINTIQDYIAFRERGGAPLGGGAMGGAANDPLGLRNP